MGGDDEIRQVRADLVVRIEVGHLIFREKLRPLDLADVVIICCCAHELRVGTDTQRCCFGKIGHLQGMLVGARRFLHERTLQRRIWIAELHQRERGGDVEGAFNVWKQPDRQHQRQKSIADAEK